MLHGPYRTLASVLAGALLTTLLAAGAAPRLASAATSCTLYASTLGSDTNAGTSTAPFRTAQKLVNSLGGGKTGCLTGGGTFVGDVRFNVGGAAGARATLTSDPLSTRATIKGVIYVPPASPYVSIENVRVDAAGADQAVAVQLFADYGRLVDSDVFGGGEQRIGVQIGYQQTVRGVEIANNRIHDFGSSGIYQQGIYVDLSDGAQVHDNLIYDNRGGYGIQLWTHSLNGHFYRNTIDGNGAGNIIIAGQANVYGGPSSNNEFDHNILSNPLSGHNVVVFWSNYSGGDPPGTGNTVHDNVYRNGDLSAGTAYCGGSCSGVAYAANIDVDPRYVDRVAKNFALQSGSPATGYGAGSGASAPAPAPAVSTAPSISGNALAGETLSAAPGSWTGSPTSYVYSWLRCGSTGPCSAVTGATAASYVLSTADAGQTVRVAVTAVSTSGSATAVSGATDAVLAAASSIKDGDVLTRTVHWVATVPKGTSSVEFWRDGIRIARQTTGFAYDLNTRRLANGSHIVGVAWTDRYGVRHPAWPPQNVTVSN